MYLSAIREFSFATLIVCDDIAFLKMKGIHGTISRVMGYKGICFIDICKNKIGKI